MRGWTRHAEQRAAERYGITPTPAEWREMLLEILAARAGEPSGAMLVRDRGRQQEWAVRLAGSLVKAGYDPETGTIATILPLASDGAWRARRNKPRSSLKGRVRRVRVAVEVWE